MHLVPEVESFVYHQHIYSTGHGTIVGRCDRGNRNIFNGVVLGLTEWGDGYRFASEVQHNRVGACNASIGMRIQLHTIVSILVICDIRIHHKSAQYRRCHNITPLVSGVISRRFDSIGAVGAARCHRRDGCFLLLVCASPELIPALRSRCGIFSINFFVALWRMPIAFGSGSLPFVAGCFFGLPLLSSFLEFNNLCLLLCGERVPLLVAIKSCCNSLLLRSLATLDVLIAASLGR